jgi:hypothetical protein
MAALEYEASVVDGVPATLQGLKDASKFPELVTETSYQGIENRVKERIVSTNMLIVWKEIDDVAARFQAEGCSRLTTNHPGSRIHGAKIYTNERLTFSTDTRKLSFLLISVVDYS